MNILVIGGGAAGLMAAGTAAENGARVTLLETNEKVGRKLFITGKGRCNVCNNCDIQTVLQNVPVNPRFLYSALGGFSPEDAMAFFTSHGVPLKTERGNRVFPVSDKAADIINALFTWIKRVGVIIKHTAAERLVICLLYTSAKSRAEKEKNGLRCFELCKMGHSLLSIGYKNIIAEKVLKIC